MLELRVRQLSRLGWLDAFDSCAQAISCVLSFFSVSIGQISILSHSLRDGQNLLPGALDVSEVDSEQSPSTLSSWAAISVRSAVPRSSSRTMFHG